MPIIRTTTNHSCLVVFLAYNFRSKFDLADAISKVSVYSNPGRTKRTPSLEILEQIRENDSSFLTVELTDKIVKDEFLPIKLISATDYDSKPVLTLVPRYNLIRVDIFDDIKSVDSVDVETVEPIKRKPGRPRKVRTANDDKSTKRGRK